jgi:hypothetical protein
MIKKIYMLKEKFKHHWKVIVGVSIVLILTIVSISLIVFFTLHEKTQEKYKKSRAKKTVFHGPARLNGEPDVSNRSIFTSLQTIVNPNETSKFARCLWVHDVGIIAATNETADEKTSIVFYEMNSSGTIELIQTIDLDLGKTLNNINRKVVNGCFAPFFNRINETYYLMISVGVDIVENGNTRYFASHILLFSYVTNNKNPMWKLMDIDNPYVEKISGVNALRIPSTEFQWDVTNPHIGSFGNKIQIVLDDNESFDKHSLYVNGTEYDPTLPGGALYWYVFNDNHDSPTIKLNLIIRDLKLFRLSQQKVPPIIFNPKTVSSYMNSFASDFFVSSGFGKNNVLLVMNNTSEDSASLCIEVEDGKCITFSQQPNGAKGYIQGFVYDLKTSSWQQKYKDDNPDTAIFLYRYPSDLNKSLGEFGLSVDFIPGVSRNVIVSKKIINNGNPGFYVLKWKDIAYNNLADDGYGSNLVNDFSVTLNSFPSNGYRYNVYTKKIDDEILVSSVNPNASSSLATIKMENGKYLTTSQYFGIYDNSNGENNPLHERYGYGQFVGSWKSKTGKFVYLVINDPGFQSKKGRFIVFYRNSRE